MSITKCEIDLPTSKLISNKDTGGATDREQRSLDIISEGIAAVAQQDRNTRGLSGCNSGGLIWKSHERLPSVPSQENIKKQSTTVHHYTSGIQVNDQAAIDGIISEENATGLGHPSSISIKQS